MVFRDRPGSHRDFSNSLAAHRLPPSGARRQDQRHPPSLRPRGEEEDCFRKTALGIKPGDGERNNIAL